MMSFHGLLVLDKPSGITSREALDRAARWFPRRTKLGHAGTLDPLATGVLVFAVGQATRLLEYVQAMPKVYRTRVRLGATSDTDDADGTVTENPGAAPVDEAAVRAALVSFVGELEQVPPAYSAAHVDGKRAYDLARNGGEVALTPRRVRIDRIDVRSYAWPELELDIACGKGTYIRSIARDLGVKLGVGGYVTVLRRLRIGPFYADEAVTLDADAEAARKKLLPMVAAVSGMPAVRITADEARRLWHGQAIPATGDGEVAVLDEAGGLVAVGRVAAGILRPEKVVRMNDDSTG
ncbi:MAG TPA: tRNA pseudouridine(55) synthase TruB [Gemmataceae bacterium]|nr:tRNA pseudouridine(55) synthase TruB [Gemmataceae bacterium]